MSKLTIEISESLRRNIAELASAEGYSIDQFLATAAAEKIAALKTIDFLRREAALGTREAFEKYLALVPDNEPDPADR